jgi:GntP family gluconate:H+ symporter
MAASPAAAIALLEPLRRIITRRADDRADGAAIGNALVVSAGHGVLPLSPVLIAGIAILDADWWQVLLVGAPVGLVTGAAGLAYAALIGTSVTRGRVMRDASSYYASAEGPPGGRIGAIVTVGVLLVMLTIQSLGDIPSEPLGGGAAREALIGVGRPFMLLLAAVVLTAAFRRPWDRQLWSDNGPVAHAIARAGPIILVIGAGGGIQVLAQNARMAELLAESLLDLRIGLALPFLVAATVKTLQGSSLVAAITAAGMIAPVLIPLGLDDHLGRALAALAVGTGAMTVSHLNDSFFWVLNRSLGLSATEGLRCVTLGTLVQGIAALAVLLALHAVLG